MGGPLSRGKLKKGCIECPWHYWEFNHKTGESIAGSAGPLSSNPGAVPTFPLKIEDGNLYISIPGETKRTQAVYNSGIMNLSREPKREAGKIRVLGISTTAMDKNHPRFSTSEELLNSALTRACTWPCSITKMDPTDEMSQIYEGMVHWADVVIVASPIRWGNASSLYYKMAERLNSVQNQITLKDKVLIQNKVVGMIITGGQDNIQSVAGQMLNFFGELGFTAPPFPYVGHSLGWSAEAMEHNMDYVKDSEYLHAQSYELLERAIELSKKLIK